MADTSTQSIQVHAPLDKVASVICDFPRYPEWVDAIKHVEVLSEYEDGYAAEVRFVIDAGVVKDDYTLSYTWTGDDRVDWTLVKGQMQKSQRGSYVLVPKGPSTEVTYALAVDLVMPMLGMFKRKAEKVIMDTALKELKKRVES